LILPAALALADWPSGAELPGAILVDLTQDGLEKAAELLPKFIPDRFDIGGFYTGDSYDSWYLWWEYGVTVTNVWGEVDLDNVDLTPATGAINFAASGQAKVNESTDPLYINVFASLYGGTAVDATCAAYIDPFDLDASSSLGLNIVDNGFDDPYLDATMGTIYWSWGLDGSQTQLRDCAIGDIDEFFDEYVGWSPIDWALGWVIDFAAGEVDKQLQDLRPTVETTIEGAFAAAQVDQAVALGESTLQVSVYPSKVDINSDGVRVEATGSVSSTPHPCVAEYGHTASLETESDDPGIGSRPADVFPHHLGIMIDDDFLNQGLFAVYNGGTLCYTATEGSGLPINTTILSILDGEAFGELFPEQKTMVIQTRPAEVPVAKAEGDHDVNVEVRKFGVDFYADLDDRMALMVGADLDIDAGANANFDNSTGYLAIDVDLSSDDITPTIRSNEFAPGDDEKIASAFSGLFKTIVEPILGSTLEGLGFALPSVQGVGLNDLEIAPSGPSSDFFGVYGTIDEVAYTGGGCDGGTTSCGGGCDSTPLPGRIALLAAPLAIALLRRRRR
jgi:hypothetical protein